MAGNQEPLMEWSLLEWRLRLEGTVPQVCVEAEALNCHEFQDGKQRYQAQHETGRRCAQGALARIDAGSGKLADVQKGPSGEPIWPAGYVGSITHGAGCAMAIVGLSEHWFGLGLDTEGWISHERAVLIRNRILRPEELSFWDLPDLSANDKSRILTAVFSLKESLFKALFPISQVWFGFQDASVDVNSFLRRDWVSGSSPICVLYAVHCSRNQSVLADLVANSPTTPMALVWADLQRVVTAVILPRQTPFLRQSDGDPE